jgi:hypothetical protein
MHTQVIALAPRDGRFLRQPVRRVVQRSLTPYHDTAKHFKNCARVLGKICVSGEPACPASRSR